MPNAMEHVRVLAEEIGPRPAGSEAERSAASYLEGAFRAYGLQSQTQAFETPRSPEWANVIYHTLTIIAAVVAGLASWAIWPATLLAALAALLVFADIGMGWGLSALMPKTRSQNVIARHIPRVRRGERMRRVVLVAHLDSPRTSLAFSPTFASAYPVLSILSRVATVLVPLILLLMAVLLKGTTERYAWYAAIAVSAYLLVPTFAAVHSLLAGSWTAGANDNATGLATLLGVLAELAPGDVTAMQTAQFARIRRGAEAALEADVVPEGALLTYAPAEGPTTSGDEREMDWADLSPRPQPQRGQSMLDFDTIDFGMPGEDEDIDMSSAAVPPPPEDAPPPIPPPEARKKSGGLLNRLIAPREDDSDVRGWLGVDDGFDAREEGRKIGSWDNFEGEEDPDDWGLKGGTAGEESLPAEAAPEHDGKYAESPDEGVPSVEDGDFARAEAARIRRLVTEGVDRDLLEKEVWFVATGAGAPSAGGMRVLLDDYGDELRDAIIINVQSVGSNGLNWVTSEGAARRYRADRRLVLLARRVSKEQEIIVKPGSFRGPVSDAMPALQQGFRAMSIMGLGANGLPNGYRTNTDAVDIVEEEHLSRAVSFLSHLIREA